MKKFDRGFIVIFAFPIVAKYADLQIILPFVLVNLSFPFGFTHLVLRAPRIEIGCFELLRKPTFKVRREGDNIIDEAGAAWGIGNNSSRKRKK